MPSTTQVDPCPQGANPPCDTPKRAKTRKSSPFDEILTPTLFHISNLDLQKEIPRLAKDDKVTSEIRSLRANIPTTHEVICMDSRGWRPRESAVHLVVTSPPYWNLKEYPDTKGQLGRTKEYSEFLRGLNSVWKRCYKALVPGGRLVCVVGDICLSRRRNGGRHKVIPLHASIQEQCQRIGFDNLAPIIWYKITNVQTEVPGSGGRYLGKPFEPNGVVKNDIEFILMLRKPGGYRSPAPAERILSLISERDHGRWFRQVWDDVPGASTRKHPAPYPEELAERLIRMFSFVGDTVLDPFAGTGTTQAAAKKWGRNSIGIEVEPEYSKMVEARLGIC